MRAWVFLASLCVRAPWASPLLAQSTPSQQIPRDVERTTEGLRESTGTAARSERQAIPEGPAVTFQEVLRNPDDPRLNAAYARAQIRAGDLLGASATLERIILTHPEAADAKLLYAFVLFRLDDSITAKTTLGEIDITRLTPAQRVEREQLLTQLENRSKRLHQSFSLSLGLHRDTNGNAAPDQEQVLVADIAATLQDAARVRRDRGYFAQGLYDLDCDLGTDPTMSLFANANLIRDKHLDVGTFNTVAGGGEVGLRRQDGPWRLQAGIFVSEMSLYGDYFLNDYGVEVKPTRRLDPRWEAFGNFRIERQAFHDVAADPTGNDNSGISSTGWLGATWRPDDANTLSLSAGSVRHVAQVGWMSNWRHAVRVSDTLVLPKGQFLIPSIELGTAIYQTGDPLVSAMTRHDHDQRISLTYGLPLAAVAGWATGRQRHPDLRGRRDRIGSEFRPASHAA